MQLRSLAATAAAALTLAACGGSLRGAEARAEAIANLTSGSDALPQAAAECIVDGVGEDNLAQYDYFNAQFQQRMDDADEAEALELMGPVMSTFLSCAFTGDAGSGDDPADVPDTQEQPVDCSTVEASACDYGDDAELDALWDACEGGDGAACDELYFSSAFGTRYEQFGNNCGDRGFEIDCAKAMGSDGSDS